MKFYGNIHLTDHHPRFAVSRFLSPASHLWTTTDSRIQESGPERTKDTTRNAEDTQSPRHSRVEQLPRTRALPTENLFSYIKSIEEYRTVEAPQPQEPRGRRELQLERAGVLCLSNRAESCPLPRHDSFAGDTWGFRKKVKPRAWKCVDAPITKRNFSPPIQ